MPPRYEPSATVYSSVQQCSEDRITVQEDPKALHGTMQLDPQSHSPVWAYRHPSNSANTWLTIHPVQSSRGVPGQDG